MESFLANQPSPLCFASLQGWGGGGGPLSSVWAGTVSSLMDPCPRHVLPPLLKWQCAKRPSMNLYPHPWAPPSHRESPSSPATQFTNRRCQKSGTSPEPKSEEGRALCSVHSWRPATLGNLQLPAKEKSPSRKAQEGKTRSGEERATWKNTHTPSKQRCHWGRSSPALPARGTPAPATVMCDRCQDRPAEEPPSGAPSAPRNAGRDTKWLFCDTKVWGGLLLGHQ